MEKIKLPRAFIEYIHDVARDYCATILGSNGVVLVGIGDWKLIPDDEPQEDATTSDFLALQKRVEDLSNDVAGHVAEWNNLQSLNKRVEGLESKQCGEMFEVEHLRHLNQIMNLVERIERLEDNPVHEAAKVEEVEAHKSTADKFREHYPAKRTMTVKKWMDYPGVEFCVKFIYVHGIHQRIRRWVKTTDNRLSLQINVLKEWVDDIESPELLESEATEL